MIFEKKIKLIVGTVPVKILILAVSQKVQRSVENKITYIKKEILPNY